MPAYPRVFQLLKSRPDAIFLDVGCCRADPFSYSILSCVLIIVRTVGTDLRKIINDGWPIPQTIATDLEAGIEPGRYPYSVASNNILLGNRVLGPGAQVI